MTNSLRHLAMRALMDRAPISPVTPFPDHTAENPTFPPINHYLEIWAIGVEHQGIAQSLGDLLEAPDDEDTLSTILDWAMHLRTTEVLNWDDAIQAALLAYLG